MEDLIPIKRALISVSDKSNIVSLAKNLILNNVEIISTGNTAKELLKNNVKTNEISEVTDFPEILGGRVKTLHPKVFGGILSKHKDKEHDNQIKEFSISKFDLVIVNLYPFEESLEKNSSFDDLIEKIDIGGPSLIRAAAKNFNRVSVVVDICDYELIINEIKEYGGITFQTRKQLAFNAISRTAEYDSIIANWFSKQIEESQPRRLTVSGKFKGKLRYGENPHQTAELYSSGNTENGLVNAKKIQGKEISYNNFNDADIAINLVSEFSNPAVGIIKHTIPCGIAESENILTSWELALRCDPLSAFGGVVALNRPLTKELAIQINKIFVELIIAPKVEEDALAVLIKKPNVRLLELNFSKPNINKREISYISGGFLIQDQNINNLEKKALRIVTKREPSDKEMEDLLFAFKAVKYIKSNAIIFAKDRASLGIGSGNTSRVDSVNFASIKAIRASKNAGVKNLAKNSVLASDAFFPFVDGLVNAHEAGASAIIQPGGSINDEKVIDEANKRNMAMVFTNKRYFSH